MTVKFCKIDSTILLRVKGFYKLLYENYIVELVFLSMFGGPGVAFLGLELTKT